MVSVGAAATAYHAARGDLRCALRKLDCTPPCQSPHIMQYICLVLARNTAPVHGLCTIFVPGAPDTVVAGIARNEVCPILVENCVCADFCKSLCIEVQANPSAAHARLFRACSHTLHSELSLVLADWTIALSSTQMVRALFPTGSAKLRLLNAASWALMPFQPTAVSTANIGIAEVGSESCSTLPVAWPISALLSFPLPLQAGVWGLLYAVTGM